VLSENELETLLLASTGWQRFTQDSPIFVDVWMGYRENPDERQDLLLEPHFRAPAGDLATALRRRLPALSEDHRLAYAGEYVVAKLDLKELLTAALPLSQWWRKLVRPGEGRVFEHLEAFVAGEPLAADAKSKPIEIPPPSDELHWLLTIAGRLLTRTSDAEAKSLGFDDPRVLTERVLEILDHPEDPDPTGVPPLWSVSLNRKVRHTLWRSRQTVKADAASRVFPADTEGLAWAVIDSGIDARHPAFRLRDAKGKPLPLPKTNFDGRTIVRATFEFTNLRERIADALLAGTVEPEAAVPGTDVAAELAEALAQGLAIDWRLYQSLIEIPHDRKYPRKLDAHGTHIAGTIAGDWRVEDPEQPRHPLEGVCPGLTLYDLRVLDANGEGDEFGVLAAMSFVRWRNARSGGTVIHGVNLSFSLDHDVRNSACGRSPVCLEAERVHSAGVVVVAAAGNDGRTMYSHRGQPPSEGYRAVSITDPGNAEAAITVGSTHRLEPHAYGVSYFSSRGPTGDGRAKPDLVAPGEKITAPVPDAQSARMDGTSMAAAHVSGTAALLMARHRELVGQPATVKQVLCDAATDLGRERHYQGRGMVDILRAMQSI
jgi:serine protease AprX